MTPLDIIISTTQKAQVGLKPVDTAGKPFTLTTKPAWTVSTGTATIQVADDGLSAWLISTDAQSDNVIDVTVPGSDVKGQITFHCDVSAPPAATLADLGLTVLQIINK